MVVSRMGVNRTRLFHRPMYEAPMRSVVGTKASTIARLRKARAKDIVKDGVTHLSTSLNAAVAGGGVYVATHGPLKSALASAAMFALLEGGLPRPKWVVTIVSSRKQPYPWVGPSSSS
jgi:hypothetical protein